LRRYTWVPDTYFASMFSGRFPLTPDDEGGACFIDRDDRALPSDKISHIDTVIFHTDTAIFPTDTLILSSFSIPILSSSIPMLLS